MTRDEAIRRLYQCFQRSQSDSDVNIVALHAVLDEIQHQESERICAILRQLHDSISLASKPTGFFPRSKT